MAIKEVWPISQPAKATAHSKARCAWPAIAFILGVSTASLAQAVSGDVDSEREYLARIDSELERVQIMVKEAGDRAPTGQRIKFRYDWLLQDLQLLRKGVADHFDAPRQPRPVPPLRGDYRQ